jgi:4-amino-4-deoxy-L-arabinose transferase-like glycosyltransferase
MQSQSGSGTSVSGRYCTAALIGFCLILFCFCLGSHRALTAHEALLAGTAKQMVLSGDWLVPRIGDQTWLEKPPLPQWLAAGTAVAWGSFNEWTMRLPFAFAGIIVVLLTVRMMTLLFDSRIGWLSGLVQASSVYMVMYARLAESDMLLLAIVMAAMTLFVEVEARSGILQSGASNAGEPPVALSPTRSPLTLAQQNRLRLAFWILVGCANLAKGLAFGSVLICFTCAGWLVLRRDWAAIRRWISPLGILLAAGIALAWPLAVIFSDPTALELWQRHLFGRAAGTLGYTQPVWYYLTQWPTQLLPWLPLMFIAAPQSWKATFRQAGADRFCWWWFLGQMALLSCSSGKHHHYLLYCLPAMSPIMAQGLVLAADWVRNPLRSWKPSTIGLSAVAGLLFCSGILTGNFYPGYRFEGFVLLPLLGLASLVLAWQLQQRQVRLVWGTLTVLVVLGHIYAQTVVMPRVDTSAADKQFLAEVDQHVSDDAILSACGSQEMALHIFYLKHPVHGIWKPENLPAALPGVQDFYVVARGQAQKELESLGDVEQILQSRFTRRERSVADRFTLFHVSIPKSPQTQLAAGR